MELEVASLLERRKLYLLSLSDFVCWLGEMWSADDEAWGVGPGEALFLGLRSDEDADGMTEAFAFAASPLLRLQRQSASSHDRW